MAPSNHMRLSGMLGTVCASEDPYLRASLGFIGLNDVEVGTVEGVAFGPDATSKAVDAALKCVAAIAA